MMYGIDKNGGMFVPVGATPACAEEPLNVGV